MNDPIEIQEVKQFLQSCVPFDQLSEGQLSKAARAVHITYHLQNSSINLLDPNSPRLYIVRSGAVEIRSNRDELLDQIDEGGCFGYAAQPDGHTDTQRAAALEDCLLYHIDAATIQALRAQNGRFDRFFNQLHSSRLRWALRRRDRDTHLAEQVADVMTKNPITISSSASVQQAAAAMNQANVSCLIVVDDEHVAGVITDRDLRSRVLARGFAGDLAIAGIMTPDPVSVEADAMLFEALLQMSTHNIHHLPVMQKGRLRGVITATDIMKNLYAEPLYLVSETNRQTGLEGLRAVAGKIPALLRTMIARDARADEVGRVVTTITDAITRQLIAQAIRVHGEPPVEFVWLGFGSQGRQEQSAKSDQDNGLLLSDDCLPEHKRYFTDLAHYVCDGLNACDYTYCPGNVMASNPQWCQPLKAWQACFTRWIEEPEPKALMHASIFFDMRAVYGAGHLFERLQQSVLGMSRNNSIFLACLTQNALKNTPPLSFFRQFVVEHNGEHKNTFDMKLRGIMPITDIARIYALANGVSDINTLKRLAAAGNTKWLTLKDARNLSDAYEFITHLRLEHQGRQLREGLPVDNHLSPDEVSGLLKHQLRDAFDVVSRAQAALKLKFTGSYL